jgi:hypothetical protein
VPKLSRSRLDVPKLSRLKAFGYSLAGLHFEILVDTWLLKTQHVLLELPHAPEFSHTTHLLSFSRSVICFVALV